MRSIIQLLAGIVILTGLFATAITHNACGQSKGINLIPENGYFKACIVIPDRATEVERYAAEELKNYVGTMTGGDISVVRESKHGDFFGFFIGRTAAGGRYARPVISPFEGANGFRLKAIPNGLVIIGADDLSTLFGVYAFLEEYQGCGWFLPDELGEVVPRTSGIFIPDGLDVTQVPDIPIRWIASGDLGLKTRMNTSVRLNGHDVGVVNQWHYHTFNLVLPPEHYFGDHPEYFSIPEGERIGSGRWQICTSNPEAIKLIAQHLIENLRHNPDVSFISLGGNDWRGWCQCTRCKAHMEPERADDPYGWVSSLIFTFDNAVARRVKKYCPGQFIKTGAYFHGYQRYPLDPSYKPEENLAIQVCHLGQCHVHSILDPECPYNVDYMIDFRKWAENSAHLHIYEYACLHGWAQLPWPMAHCLKVDMPEYHRSGAEMFYTQAVEGTFEAYAMHYFIAAKLAWDASLDVDDLITEFCSKMYGEAGPAMERYFRMMEGSWESSGVHFSYMIEPASVSMVKLFPAELIAKADGALHDAESIAGDPSVQRRIQLIRTDFDYLRMVLHYLHAISAPFSCIDREKDPAGWEDAAAQAVSIGEMIAPTIWKFLEEHYPGTVQPETWTRQGVTGILRTHMNPERIPGAREN